MAITAEQRAELEAIREAHDACQASLATMALGETSLAERLLDAYRANSRSINRANQDLLPPPIRAAITELHAKMTAAGPGPEGSIAKTVNQMDDDEVRAAARDLIDLARLLDQAMG